MEIILKRIAKKPTYTIGHLYINGCYVCDTLEDADRGLTADMAEREVLLKKTPGKTAIPTGEYQVTVNVGSPKFGAKAFYRKLCSGRLPRLLDVPGFSGVLIHCGNTADDTDGCILVGENKEVGRVLKSQTTFTAMYNTYFKSAQIKGEKITIKII